MLMNLKPLFARSIAHGAALVLMLGLAACGGGGGGGGGGTTTPTVTSVEVTPTAPSAAAGTTTQLAATAILSDGTQLQISRTGYARLLAAMGESQGKPNSTL